MLDQKANGLRSGGRQSLRVVLVAVNNYGLMVVSISIVVGIPSNHNCLVSASTVANVAVAVMVTVAVVMT